jgi:BASS family bile acid:Na+ symporter
MNRALSVFADLFPVWILLGGISALFMPGLFTWFRGQAIVWGLAVIMLGMGITLSVDDFKRVLKLPQAIALGFIAHYCIMPLLGWSIAHGLRLETPFAVGLILVSCCPSGTASNVVNFLARSDVPLAVLVTMCSTFGAVLMTPLLTKWLAGSYVEVQAWHLFLDTVQIVLAPVLLGLALHHLFPRLVKAVLPAAPAVSVAAIALICSSVIGQNARNIQQSGGLLLLAVFLLHAGGFFWGYVVSRLLGFDRLTSRTLSVEVGMQNSGLGVALAQKNFPLLPAASVPCAVSATFHSVIGSLLAGIWRLRPVPTAHRQRLSHSKAGTPPPARDAVHRLQGAGQPKEAQECNNNHLADQGKSIDEKGDQSAHDGR